MTWRHLPNAITVGRAVMVVPLLWALVAGHYRAALVVVCLAGASDVLDGWLAKRFDWRSALGGLLDPVADKLFLGAAMAGLWWVQALPGWLLAVLVGRDLVILAGACTWWYAIGPFKPAPTWVSKLTTLLQVLLVGVLLVDLALSPVTLEWRLGLMLATAALTVASGADYVVRYGVRALRTWRSRR